MGSPARQVRFMSTQKREHRSQRTRCRDRAGAGYIPIPAAIARYVCAAAHGRTAPLMSILCSALAWVATAFLRSDHHIGQLVRPVMKADRCGSPPPGVRHRAVLGKQASPRSSLPHTPYPSGLARLHPPLPQAPDGHRRRAERYDGKRDMYFQHTA